MKLLILFSLVLLFNNGIVNSCSDDCKLPKCSCFSTESPIPEGRSQTPQIVVMSFDDAVNARNMDLYDYLSEYVNPNGCPISMTFFVSHEYTEYDKVHELHRKGHEIAIHSVTHKPAVDTYWEPANSSVWSSEMADAKYMIEKYGRVNQNDITGFRAPFLVVGGDAMYEALVDNGFKYDCSWPTRRYTNWHQDTSDQPPLGPIFPFTMDYATPIDDPVSGTRPTGQYKGFWEVPMVTLQDERGEPCAMLDACQGPSFNCTSIECEENLFSFLKRSFDKNYLGSRTPFGIYSHESWFHVLAGETHLNAYIRFMDYLDALDDVWIISINKLISWMENPASIDEIYDFEPFKCSGTLPKSRCGTPKICPYNIITEAGEQQERMFHICGECPPKYPWLGNVDGL